MYGEKEKDQHMGRSRVGTTRVLLSCGCRIPLSSNPVPGAVFSCYSGLGHGSKLTWVNCVEPGGFMKYNPDGPEAHLADDRNPEVLREWHRERQEERERRYTERAAAALPHQRRPKQPEPSGVLLLLECGCTKRVKDEPLPNEHFRCPKREHGVSVRWKHAEIDDRLMVNTGPGI